MKGLSKKLLAVAAGVIFCALCFGTQLRAEDMVSGTAIRPTVVKDFEDEEGIGSVQAQEFAIPEGQYKYVIPLEMPIQGCIGLVVDLGENKKAIDWGLYEDTDREKEIYLSSNKNKKEKDKYCWLDQKTYYLGIEVNKYSDGLQPGDVHISVKSYCFDVQKLMKKTDLVLKSGKWVSIYPYETTYLKVVFPKNGYIQVDIKPAIKKFSMRIYICNQKKKTYSSSYEYFAKRYYNGFSREFAVKKGTYYLRLDGASYGGPIKLKYTYHTDPSKKNYTMDKAITLKPDQFVTDVYYSDVKETTYQRWYKINVKNKRRLKLILKWAEDSSWDGYYTIHDSKGNIATEFDQISEWKKWWVLYTDDKVKPGTYYIRVSSRPGTYYSDLGDVTVFKWK